MRDGILHGAKEEIAFAFEAGKSDRAIKHHWDGVLGELDRRYERASEAERKELARYRSPRSCTDCDGSRLRIEARSIRVCGESIAALTRSIIRYKRW